MPNAYKGNTHFVDTTGTLYTGKVRVISVRLQAGSAVATLVLRDNGATGSVKIDVGEVAANNSKEANVFTEFETDLHATISGAGATAQIDVA